MQILLLILLIPNLFIFGILLWNLFYASNFEKFLNFYKSGKDHESGISILIPARNEAKNILRLLESLKSNLEEIRDSEIIILNDNSTDETQKIVEEFINRNKDLNCNLINSAKLPEGWSGKNWACYQLAIKARFETLLFLDADVFFYDKSLKVFVKFFISQKLDLLSFFPRQDIHDFKVKLILPLMNFILLGFLPLEQVYTSQRQSLSAANGQVMFFRKKAYGELNPHEVLKSVSVEDIEIMRLFKANKKRGAVFSLSRHIGCNMYNSLNSAINGLARSFYPGSKMHAAVFIPLIIFMALTQILPFILVFWKFDFLFIIIIISLNRTITSMISGEKARINLLLHLPQMFMLIYLGLKSVYLTKSGKLIWKDRKVNA